MLGLNSEKLFASSGYGLDLSSIVQSTFPLYLFGTLTSWREGEGKAGSEERKWWDKRKAAKKEARRRA